MATKTRNTSIFRLGDLPKNVADRVTTLPRELAKDAADRGRDVWLAGLGALATAEEEGTTLFQTLVRRGEKMEARGKERIESVRTDLTTRQRELSDRVTGSVDDVVETTVEPLITALKRFGVPTRTEVQELSANVDALAKRVNALIQKLEKQPAAAPVPPVYTVSSVAEGWVVEQDGLGAPLSVHPTKDEAVERARVLANDHAPSQLVVLRKDGTVQDTYSYEA